MVSVKILLIFGNKKKKKKGDGQNWSKPDASHLNDDHDFHTKILRGNGFPIPEMKRTLASCNLDGYRSLGHLRSPT